MKKLFSLLLCLAIFSLPLCAVNSFAAGESFVVLGDSIAEGVGSTDVTVDSYAALVAKANGYKLSNISKGGSTSFTLVDKVMNDEAARKIIRDADIIEISIGGNDFLLNDLVLTVATALAGDYTRVDATLEAYEKNFTQTIDELRSLNPEALIIVQTLYNPLEMIPGIGRVYGKVLSRLNGFYDEYLEKNPGAYVISDVYGAFAGKTGLIAKDTIHPSVKGHALIAETLLDTIAEQQVNAEIPETGSAISGAVFALAAGGFIALAASKKRK